MCFLKIQLSNRTLTRFQISGYEPAELEEMLMKCYKAEVLKRKGEFVCDKNTVERVRKAAKWIDGTHKPGLLIYGAACGTGKTTLANAMCDFIDCHFYAQYSSERKSVTKVTATELVKIYTEYPNDYKKILNTRMLFIDDIGTEPVNIKIYGNEYSPVTELLYGRYDSQKMTIATSNLSEEQIKQRYGERINDRLREMFDKMYFQGKSYRR